MELIEKIKSKNAKIGIIGLGYVGLPLVLRFCSEKFHVIGFDGEIKWDTTKPDGTPRKLLDVSRLKSLGWEPKVSLEEGVRRTYGWYKMVCLN